MDTKERTIDPKVTRAVSRAFFMASYKRSNPEATKEQTQEAWTAAASEQRTIARKALRRLAAKGVTFTVPVDMTKSDAESDTDAD